MTKQSLYTSDIALWSEEMARLLRERRFDEVDVENVAEEIESLGRSDKQQLENRIIEIIEHLLKLDLMTGDDRTRNMGRDPGRTGRAKGAVTDAEIIFS